MDAFMNSISEAFSRFGEDLLRFMPSAMAALMMLALGVLAAWLVRLVLTRALTAMKFDEFVGRAGGAAALAKMLVRDRPSMLAGKAAGLLVFVVFTVVSLHAFDVPAFERLIEAFFLYMPNLFVAAAVLVVGFITAKFLGRAALIAAVNAGFSGAATLGTFVELAVFIMSCTMALEQLGIGQGTVVAAFAITYGGIVLALAIAFGIGGRHAARKYIEDKLRPPEDKGDGINHL